MRTKKLFSFMLALVLCLSTLVVATVSASAEETTYTITFDKNDGEGTLPENMTGLENGASVTLGSGDLSREGYKFLGWNTNKTATIAYTTTYTVASSDATNNTITMYAIWVEKESVTIYTDAQKVYSGSTAGYTLTGKDAGLGNFVISYEVSGSWTETIPTASGSYNVKIFREEDGTYKRFEATINKGYVVLQPAVTEPEVVGTYKYNGKEQTVVLRGDQTYISTTDSITQTKAGIYTITFTLAEGCVWADGSDGVVTWEITENIHWAAAVLLLAFIIFMALCWFVFQVRQFFTNGKFNLLPAIGFVIDLIGLVVIACMAQCVYCSLFLIINAVIFAFFVVIYLDVHSFGKKTEAEIAEEELAKKAEEDAQKAEEKEETPVEVEEAKDAEDEAPAEDGLALKEAIALAVANANNATEVNKKTVADFLKESYGDQVEVNCRANYIKSGLLPLADTHYKMLPDGKKCFMYVYELKGGQVFFLVRANETVAKEIAEKHPSFTHSAYPKTKFHDWYTMLLDDSYASSSDIFDTLAFVFENFGTGDKVEFRSSVDVMTAHILFTNKQIEGMMINKEVEVEKGTEDIINVDTLSENFENEDEINIEVLKEKGLISSKAKRVKILARGVLDKKLKVTANAFSYDAAKMIVAVGGTVIRLKEKK